MGLAVATAMAVSLFILESQADGKVSGIVPASAGGENIKVEISVALLTELMESEIAGKGSYLQRLRDRRGEQAAMDAENLLRAPYKSRINEIRATGRDSVSQDVQVLTLRGRLRFSALSYDGSLKPKDPVSVVFFGEATTRDIYQWLLSQPSCPAAPCAAFQDENGPHSTPDGMQHCHSSSQWVLMGNAGEELEWRRNSRGLMHAGGSCAAGVRDHARLFGEAFHEELGLWFVATPHREGWRNGAHVIESWVAAAQSFLEVWTAQEPAGNGPAPGGVAFRWQAEDWGTVGVYQNVSFSGLGYTVEVYFPD